MRPVLGLSVLVALLLALPASALAVGPDQRRDGRAVLDVTSTPADAGRVARAPAARRAAAAALRRSLGPQGQVLLDRVTGTPRSVARLDGFLTGATARSARDVVLKYVRSHADLFGLDAGDLAGLRLTRSYVDAIGTTHLTFVQQAGGVSTAANGLRAAVTRYGRLLNVQGAPIPDLDVATTPRFSATAALDAARADAGIRGHRPRVERTGAGPQRLTRFAGDNQARLVVASTFAGPRLAWEVVADKSADQLYAYTIDAATGKVLRRGNTVKFATGLAWDYFPGPIPSNNSGVATSRDFTAKGWLASDATTLSGNNAHAYFDLLDDNTPAAGDEVPPSSGSNWNYSLTRFNDDSFFVNCSINFPCSWDSGVANSWQTNMKQGATQAFYFVNNFHDYLKNTSSIGFTEAAGNFQVTNSTGQGLAGDAVQVQSHDGANTAAGFPDAAHFNNAHMDVRGDGTPPRLQLGLMSGLEPNGGDVYSGDDASVVYHEYAHGMTNRLVTDVDGNPALLARQSAAMDEGWSNFYAMDFLVNHGYDADNAEVGDVNPGYYVAGGPGLLSQPMDCPVDVTDDPCTNFNGAGDGGYSYDDYGKVAGSPEPHADGEIWGQTLWELRQRLVAKYGATAGDARVQTYVTRGMELTPPSPSMLDARNGILQAETAATAAGGPFAGSDDDDVLWTTFAHRGMGYFAGALDGDDVNPIANSSLPPAPGASHGTLTGTVNLQDGGSSAGGARVEIGGHNSGLAGDLAATTGSDGHYAITGVPNGTYPYVFVGGPGYDRAITANVAISGTTTRNFTVRRNWAQRDGGATVDSFSAPDLSGSGCGPQGAIDGSQATGWSSTSPASTQGPGGVKQLTVKLPRAITLSQLAVDPGATCGDDDNASVGSYKIESSTNGTTFTQTNAGTFTAANNHMLNALTPGGGTAGVRYVRFTMNAPQSSAGSGKDWMDLSELKVYGVPAGGSGIRGDFNGDGFADVATGVPGEDVGSLTDAGLVNVIYGSPSGLSGTGAQAWTPNSPGVVGTSVAGARFGAAVAVGDFNGDGFADLAVGAPRDPVGSVSGAGSVTILLGSPSGLTGTGSARLNQAAAGVHDNPESGDAYGAALAAADMGRGAQSDLAIGVPGENSSAGVVQVVYGSASGLGASTDTLYSQASAGSTVEVGDSFGSALAAGDFGQTATADLAIGAPGEDAGTATDAGAVSVFYGTTTGLTTTGRKTLTQNSPGMIGNDAAGDKLGTALATGDMTGSANGDLAIGVPGKDIAAKGDAGEVLVLPGSASGLTTTGSHVRHEDAPGVPDNAEAGDRFGAALAAADLAGSAKADLAVGSPGEGVGTTLTGAGQVTVLLGSSGQLATAGATAWNQNTAGVVDTAEADDHFGTTLATGQFGSGPHAGLAVGVPDEDVGSVTDAGAVAVLYGGAAVTATGNAIFNQASAGVPDNAEAGDGLARALAGG